MTVAVAGALAVTALAGCGSDAGGDEAAVAATTAPPPLGAELAGRYAHWDVVAYEGELMNTMIVTYGFADLSVVDGELISQQTFCHAETRTNLPIETGSADAMTQAIKPPPVAVTVTEEDGALRLFRPETPTGIGITLADPANDVLPTDPNDPRISDDDGDGNPGVTAFIKVSEELQGELYLARRERFAYDVVAQDDGSLRGNVIDKSEQLIIGASDPTFMVSDTWVQHPDPSKSPILWKPVPDDWDCDRLMAESAALLPPIPPLDW